MLAALELARVLGRRCNGEQGKASRPHLRGRGVLVNGGEHEERSSRPPAQSLGVVLKAGGRAVVTVLVTCLGALTWQELFSSEARLW